MHTWNWRTCEDLPYLTCSLLKDWKHGFFTQQFSPRTPAEITSMFQPQAEAYRVKQVHGNVVLSPREIGDTLAEADGLITELPKQAVWVASADCTPVLIADSTTGQVAALHAGWRGTAAKIVPEAIAKLQSFGSKLENLKFALGPAISGSVYQVSEQVAAEVGSSIIANDANLMQTLQELPNPPILPDPHPGRVRLDVRRVIALQLENLGVNPEQVAVSPHCTYSQPDHFFSYRRDKLKKVQWSGIFSKDFTV
ncbi:peptidoglycan editing factor PgeF [Synechocystis sp. PCC 7509]|uniref:peptidoglycan editing factor PgeF n=1 Tax=Synechocystis sp. PCC 7509 TaxID=927677 RepID=UPI0002AC9E9C|nr:peptidoglycan editing factor PgeF [Synechocystis sp. PCC 7509]